MQDSYTSIILAKVPQRVFLILLRNPQSIEDPIVTMNHAAYGTHVAATSGSGFAAVGVGGGEGEMEKQGRNSNCCVA